METTYEIESPNSNNVILQVVETDGGLTIIIYENTQNDGAAICFSGAKIPIINELQSLIDKIKATLTPQA